VSEVRLVALDVPGQARENGRGERTVSQFANDTRPSVKQAEIRRKRRSKRVKREVRHALHRVRDQGMDSQEAARVVAEQLGVEQRTLSKALRLTYGGMCELPPHDSGQSTVKGA
jgi:hypothetical protein